jgi:HAD superfamily hydrolase (TIGR01509 family)
LLRLDPKNADWPGVTHLYDAFAHLPYLPYDETRPVLEALRAKGLKFGLISNHSRLIRPVIERILGEFIPPSCMVISQEVGAYKPDRRIYRHACVLAQAKPAATIFVGDHLQVDAIGAVEAGGVGLGLWVDRNGTGNGNGNGHSYQNGNGMKTAVLPPNVARITSLWQILDYV